MHRNELDVKNGARLEFAFNEDNRLEIEGRSELRAKCGTGDGNRSNHGKKHTSYLFDSLHEFIQYYCAQRERFISGEPTGLLCQKWMQEGLLRIQGGQKGKGGNIPESFAEEVSRGDFLTHLTPAEFVKTARFGYEHARKKMSQIALSIARAACVVSREMEIHFDYNGPEVDIERLRRGDPECAFIQEMSDNMTTSVNGKVIELSMGVQATCYVSSNTMLTRGATVLAMVECLENAGYNVAVNIYGMGISHNDGQETVTLQCRIKHAHQPLDVDTMTVALADGDIFRRAIFLLFEQQWPTLQQGEYANWGSYGHSQMEQRYERSVTAKHQGSRIRLDEVRLLDASGQEIQSTKAIPYSDVQIAHNDVWDGMIQRQSTELMIGGIDRSIAQHAKWLIDNIQQFGIEAEHKGAAR